VYYLFAIVVAIRGYIKRLVTLTRQINALEQRISEKEERLKSLKRHYK
jgi:uncharacterized damage-inducible protein DinB